MLLLLITLLNTNLLYLRLEERLSNLVIFQHSELLTIKRIENDVKVESEILVSNTNVCNEIHTGSVGIMSLPTRVDIFIFITKETIFLLYLRLRLTNNAENYIE